jgi:hypothetical protein
MLISWSITTPCEIARTLLEVVVGLDNGRVAREGIRLDIVQLDNRRVARGVPVRL